MRVLLHFCCGPCAIMPLRELLQAGHEVAGWFYNPNIHPLAEYMRRREGAQQVAGAHSVRLFFPEQNTVSEYDVATWCKEAFAHTEGRCAYCRESRFDALAAAAKTLGFDAFSSSLLYSRHQDHQGMIRAGEKASQTYGPTFLYQDFRPFWQNGIMASKELGVYRQQYCGCVFSEEDRYAKELTKVAAGAS